MKIIVGITGASGVEMGYALLRALKAQENCESLLVVSDAAKENWQLETTRPLNELLSLADHVYDNENMAASISSGSNRTDGMIVIPCSMKTLAGIAAGYAEDLILRAADVCLKEGRRVVLVPREMPFGKVHLRNMKEAADLGCVIVPPVLTFYNDARTLDAQIDHIIGKILMQFGLQYRPFKPWGGAGRP